MWRSALLLLIACSNKNATPEAEPAPEPVEAPAPAPEPAPVEAASQPPTPQSLYDECQERVEGRQKEGECTVDDDCKTAGCGSEVCTTVADAAEVMTTCEGKLCFKILDTCGCHEGMCTWTIKDEIPAQGGQPATKLPTKLPGAAPAPDAPPAKEAPADDGKE